MKVIILSIFGLVLLAGCNKYDDTAAAANLQVPPFTETGANTFGCYVNGAAWANLGETDVQAEEGFAHLVPNQVLATIGQSYLKGIDSMFYIQATLTVSHNGKVSRQESMNFSMPKNGSLVGIHKIIDSTITFGYTNELNLKSYYFFYKNHSSFTITILKDSAIFLNHIVSGKFTGTLSNYANTDSVKISGGVFDATAAITR